MSIFSQSADVPRIMADRLMRLAATYFPDAPLSHAYVWEKLLAEETLFEQRTRTKLGVREVLPTGADASEYEAFATAGMPVLEEPGYDYDPRFFNGDAWGLIELRNKPIVTVHSVVFAYPNVDNVLFSIPPSWIRPDKKYGKINLVPGTDTAINLPANAYILSALGGGRTIPFMVQVRYQVGMPNIRTDRPDIVDTIIKLTVLAILDDLYLPASGSSSLDGLSQSLSFDASKYRELVDKRVDTIASSLNGIRFMAM